MLWSVSVTDQEVGLYEFEMPNIREFIEFRRCGAKLKKYTWNVEYELIEPMLRKRFREFFKLFRVPKGAEITACLACNGRRFTINYKHY